MSMDPDVIELKANNLFCTAQLINHFQFRRIVFSIISIINCFMQLSKVI